MKETIYHIAKALKEKTLTTFGAILLATNMGGCALQSDWRHKADIRGLFGDRSATLDARVMVKTPIQIADYPVGVFVRDRLSGGYANSDQRDEIKLTNFSITDVNYGGDLKVLVGARTLSTIDTQHTHDSTGRINVRAGLQYGTKAETEYGTLRVFASPTAILDPRAPKRNPQGEILLTLGYAYGDISIEAETITRFNKKGIQQATQRFQGFYDLEDAIGLPLSIGPQVELNETRERRNPVVNAGGVLRLRW